MATKEDKKSINIKTFDPKKSIERAKSAKTKSAKWSIRLNKHNYVWGTRMERVAIIRTGLPYESIEVISKKADLPVKKILQLLGVPQTTYNNVSSVKCYQLSGMKTEGFCS